MLLSLDIKINLSKASKRKFKEYYYIFVEKMISNCDVENSSETLMNRERLYAYIQWEKLDDDSKLKL